LRREEIIVAIEKLEESEVHPQRVADLKVELQAYSDQRMNDWQGSLLQKALLVGIFGPMFIAILPLAKNSSFMFPAWLLLVSVSLTIGFSWVYMRLMPRPSSEPLGLHKKCVRCSYNLTGLESALGDELWVGPEVCPECGQKYPAISE